jgi:sigma-E factor negative regulatory protein RseA
MKEKVSQLMDGELAGEEAAPVLAALESGGEARDAWRLYHLIGDSLRETRVLSHGFSARVGRRLAEEPTLTVPAAALRPWLRRRLPIVAVGAIALLVILVAEALRQAGGPGQAPEKMARLPEPSAVRAPEPAQGAADVAGAELPEGARDYLLAHQGYSPRHALQGYARTVSDIGTRRK